MLSRRAASSARSGGGADVFDDAVVNGVGWEAKGLAVVCEGVEKDVGGGVASLAFLTDEAGDAGEEGEEVEKEVAR